MSEQSQSEQSMDEILASIRKIISDEPPTRPENRLPTPSDLQPVPSAHGSANDEANDDLGDILEPISETLKEALDEPPRPAEALNAPLKDARDMSWPFDARPSASSEAAAVEPPPPALSEPKAAKPSYAAAAEAALSPAIDRIEAAPGRLPEATAETAHDAPVPSEADASQVTIAGTGEPEAAPAVASPVRLGPSLHPRPVTAPIPEPSAAPVPPVAVTVPEAPKAPEPVLAKAVETVLPVPPAPAEMPPTEPEAEPEPATAKAGVAEAAAAAIIHTAAKEAAASPDLGKRTLEDVVVEALRPMLQEWIDENLPRIAKEVVKSELSRISDDSV